MKRIFLTAGFLLLSFNMNLGMASQVQRININTADSKQLLTLKGIGVKKAKAIVLNRKQHGLFHTLNDLTRIRGIGQHFLQSLLKKNAGRIMVKSH